MTLSAPSNEIRQEPGDAGRALGLIAGRGPVPLAVAEAAVSAGRRVFIVGLDGFADPDINRFPHGWVRLGQFGRAVRLLRAAGCRDLVMCGPLTRPSLWRTRPDWLGLRLVPRFVRLLRLGDDALLSGIVDVFEQRGFRVVSVEDVAQGLRAPEGVVTRASPDEPARKDIEIAAAAARGLGARDVGQGAVARGGEVIALEDAGGTDAMLDAVLRSHQGRAGVLVKLPKPQQDRRVDLPTIGVTTVEKAAAAGLAGIAVEAGGALVFDIEAVARRADELGLFVVGLPPRDAVRAHE